MQVGPWQGQEAFLHLADFLQRITQQRQRRLVQLQGQGRTFVEHPDQAAVAPALQHPLAGGQVQARQQGADLGTVVGIGFAHMRARQTRLQQCRLLRQLAQGLAAFRAQGVGHRQAGVVEHVEQFDEERQVVAGTALHQGQYVFTLFQADEEVAVLGAFGNALEILQPTQPVGGEEGFQFRAFEWGEYGHWTTLLRGFRVRYQLKISQAGISMSGLSERT
ncbi:hypothetical protein D9M71_477060 [compost metagenome]